MLDQRTTTLVGSDLLFIAVSFLLFRQPDAGPALYPLYGLILFWSDFRRESETPIIFLFLIAAAGALLGSRQPELSARLAIGVEAAGILALAWAVALHRDRAFQEQRARVVEKLALDAQIKDDERDLRYYKAYEEKAGSQISLRRDLTESAKSLGATMDRREVHERLVATIAARFPESRVTVASEPGGDPAIEWALQRKGPLLIKDVAGDERFRDFSPPPAYRSCLVVPLKVMRQPAGFIKLESDAVGAFAPDDVKTVDLFATMASLSLENIQFYEQVNDQATHDALTQLFSHKAFQGRLQEEVLRSGRSQTPLSLIMCDIDHFKRYNDRFGHQAGDHLLRTVAAILSSFARPVDMVARYGGEEFCLVLPNFVRSEAVQLAERIRVRLASEPFVFQGQNTNATMSFGVASFPQDATSASQFVRAADERLYRAKEGGRNQVVG
jgi:diguanylate cyclase (GGDEF)-like protein